MNRSTRISTGLLPLVMQNSKFKMQTLNGRPDIPFACCILHFALRQSGLVS
jgi:hypothetical protein